MNEDQTQLQMQEKWKTRAYAGVAVIALCVLIGAALYVFGIIWQAVATVITTAIIAFLLHGLVNNLEARGMSRLLATVIAIIVFLAVLGGVFAIFVPALADQLTTFGRSVPGYARDARSAIEDMLAFFPADNALSSSLLDQATAWIQEESGNLIQTAAGGILSGAVGLGNALLIFFLALICAFWVLVDMPTISRELMALFNDDQQRTVRVVSSAFNTAVYGWLRATLACAFVIAVINGVALWAMGVPYFALLGLLCGITYFIPYLGSVISAVVVVLGALLVSVPMAVAALVMNVVVHAVVANVLSPRLMRSSVSVHPAIILVVILIGGALGGVAGMLFSIPIAAAAQGVFITFFEERTGRELATEDGALFRKPKVKVTPTFRKRPRKSDD